MVIWVTDADGPDALEIAGTSGEPAGTRRIAAGELGYVASLAPSPDGTHVAVAAHDGRLLIVTVESGRGRRAGGVGRRAGQRAGLVT